MKNSILVLFAMLTPLLASCNHGGREDDFKAIRVKNGVDASCAYISTGENACKPNLHRLFVNPEEYRGVKVSVSVFATYSSRGSLLIYPGAGLACDALDFTAFEVFPSNEISDEIENSLRTNGVARVVVTGYVSNVGMGALAVIGKIDKASVIFADQTGLVLLENPKKVESDESVNNALGKSKAPSCLRSTSRLSDN
jgi:hypothetical protein